MKKNDRGMTELLDLLKTHPGLVRDLVFDPGSILWVLKNKSARRLVRNREVRRFLTRMAAPAGGYATSQCYSGTQTLCGKGTLACVGNTKPTPICPGNTKPSPPICRLNTLPI